MARENKASAHTKSQPARPVTTFEYRRLASLTV